MVIALAALLPGWALAASEIPESVRSGLEAALKKRLGELASEKDAEGIAFKRGTYSESFRPAADGAYTLANVPDGDYTITAWH